MKASHFIYFVIPVLLLTTAPGQAAERGAPPAKPAPAESTAAADASGKAATKPASRATSKSQPAFGNVPAVVDINSASEAELQAHPMIGATAAKAIIAARPFSSLDDLSRLQGLSAERIEQIRLAVHAPALAAETPAPDRIGPERNQVDVNTADRATLEALASVGPELASAIIAARPFKRIDDLDRIQGISAERLEQMRTELIVGTPAAATAQTPPAKKKRASSGGERELTPTGRGAPDARR